jgi:hypothetical protein
MPAPHGRIEHLELQNLERLRVRLRAPFLDLRAESLLDQEPDEGLIDTPPVSTSSDP